MLKKIKNLYKKGEINSFPQALIMSGRHVRFLMMMRFLDLQISTQEINREKKLSNDCIFLAKHVFVQQNFRSILRAYFKS